MADSPEPEPTPATPPPHKRRVRYRGTHPRQFEERYKEKAPAKYPELVAHVRESGRTPAGQHVPIMVDEVIAAITSNSNLRGVDATLGYGGHAEQISKRLLPEGQLLALDADPIELPKTEARLRALGCDEKRLIIRRTNFAGLRKAIDEVGWQDGVDFVFADLGVSSMQIDDPARGFTFKADGPLDMRMNPRRGLSAAQWLERATPESLTKILFDHSDEPNAKVIAEALCDRKGTLTSTTALADAVRASLPPRATDDVETTVRRVFQALRIEVNDEFGALDALLRQLPDCLRAGGRAALLSFHSGEDRRVKKAFQKGLADGTYFRVSDDMTRPSPAEQRANPRSSPAKLRWAERGG